MIEAIDSFSRAVEARMATINANRALRGVLMAQDWPTRPVEFEAFYLLTLGESHANRSSGSATIPIYEHQLQWVWIVKGTELAEGEIGRSRGSRYRTHYGMKGELLKALYPKFTEKKNWSVDGSGNLVGVNRDPKEFIYWSYPKFIDRHDQESGLIYGAAAVSLTNFTDEILN